MRKRTGLHNRGKSGRSTYSVKNKRREADSYGSYQSGRSVTGETIAGKNCGSMLRMKQHDY